ACLWVECFVAAAVERSEPALRAAPLAVVAPAPSVTRVVDANPAAREYGVRAGVTETEARARCPTLVSRPFVREHVAAARHALLEAALGVSPRVEDGGAGLVYVDAAGLTWLHGDPAAVGRRVGGQGRGGGLRGLRAHDLALGHDRDPFCAWTPPPFWDEAQGLEWEIDSLGALAVVLDAVLGRLCARLVAASLAADALDVRLELASGGHHARAVA